MKKYVNDYVNYEISEKKSLERTINKYVMCINEMIDMMNIKTIEDIDSLTWVDLRQNWIRKKEREGLGASSLNLRISAARSFFSYLKGRRLIKNNEANEIKKFKCNAKEVEVDVNKIKNMIKDLLLFLVT